MWSILASIFGSLLSIFFNKKKDAEKEQKESVNVNSRTTADISRNNQNATEQKLSTAEQENVNLASSVSTGSVSDGADSLNEAIRRANSKTHR